MQDEIIHLERRVVRKPEKNKNSKKNQNIHNKKRRPAKKRNVWLLNALLWISLFVLLAAVFVFQLFPLLMFVFAAMLLLALVSFLVRKHTFARSKAARLLTSILVILAICINLSVSWMLYYTDKMLDIVVTDVSSRLPMASAVVLKESGINSLSELKGKKIAFLPGDAGADLAAEKIAGDYVAAGSVYKAAGMLYDGEVSAMILPENERQNLHDTEAFYEFQFLTKTIWKEAFEGESGLESFYNPSDPVNPAYEPYTILVSGTDSYGNLPASGRSDVNMLVTVHPLTHQVLIVSLPRDSYVNVSCTKDASACAAGGYDKLTHTGIDGAGVTESTIEDFMDIIINYTVRVNFSSLTSVVDALGGVDVFVEDGLAVDAFWTNPYASVEEGWNHLDGEEALAFSRERYSYAGGDLQRIKNQQIVMKAILSRLLSWRLITDYPALMDAASSALETNLTESEIKSILSSVLIPFPLWNIQSMTVSGVTETAWCQKLQDYASVTIVDEDSLGAAAQAIYSVKSGHTVELNSIQEPSA